MHGSDLPELLTLFSPSGLSVSYDPGDAGTMYLLEVDGKPVLVDVTDKPGATEFAATMAIAA